VCYAPATARTEKNGSVVESDKTLAMQQVANLLMRPGDRLCQEVLYSEEWVNDLNPDAMMELTVGNVQLRENQSALNTAEVKLWILPKGQQWMSFHASKQSEAIGKRFLLLRSSSEEVALKAVNEALMDHAVALVGHDGIGKSVEINIVLYYLFQRLLTNESPLEKVYYRFNRTLYVFTVVGDTIECRKILDKGDNLFTLKKYFADLRESEGPNSSPVKRVLVLEMEETENDPSFDDMPTIIALCVRDVFSSKPLGNQQTCYLPMCVLPMSRMIFMCWVSSCG